MTTGAPPAIRVDALCKSFASGGRHRRPLYRELLIHARKQDPANAVRALHDISFEVPTGSCVALIGPNGAGKSTLLRSLAGIYRPTSGSISVDGAVACHFETGAGLAPTLSVLDNIFLYAAILGMGLAETRAAIDEILDTAELEDERYRAVEHLSHGTRQRMYFAVMIQTMKRRKADLFLFDEWLGGTDMYFRNKGEKLLQQMQTEELTMVYASHNLKRIERMCDLAIYLHKGELRAFGPADEVIEVYRADEQGSDPPEDED